MLREAGAACYNDNEDDNDNDADNPKADNGHDRDDMIHNDMMKIILMDSWPMLFVSLNGDVVAAQERSTGPSYQHTEQ